MRRKKNHFDLERNKKSRNNMRILIEIESTSLIWWQIDEMIYIQIILTMYSPFVMNVTC